MLATNRLICHWVGLHFHHPFEYNGRFACKIFLPLVTKMGSLIDHIKVYNGKGFWEASGTYLSIIYLFCHLDYMYFSVISFMVKAPSRR